MTTPNQAPLLRELIDIPESMTDSELVMELASGVTNAEETLREYVITESLVENFDEALGLVKAAVTGQRSKATYLHGSFGAGKSHFMAVLHALLRGESAARGRDEFAGLLAGHEWMEGKKFLLVPLHLLGAKSLEQRVFSRYIEYVRRLHPAAPIPAVHRTDALLDEVRHLREQIGDQQFIAGLPGREGEEDEWGDSPGTWTSAQLDAAMSGAYDGELRRKLVNDVLQTWKRGFFRDAKEDAEAFVSLDAGLKEISRHARELGYDSLILFLDELVLWLINSSGDSEFVSREMQKVTNFVESGDPDRPAPVVSFIARQRDLREALGDEVVGGVELKILDTLDLASARFSTIQLSDTNLPVVARERVLHPLNDAADAQITAAFEQTTRLRPQVWDTLLGTGGGAVGTAADVDSFRKTYPFSPAFMDTLVHLSSALQRSRTAIKLMRRILIRRRHELRLGQLIPLGDLYDVITEGGDEPFTQKLKAEFTAAQTLYARKLRPYLLDKYGLTDEDIARVRRGDRDEAIGKVRAFTGDDRLMKTLLLSALAPTVPALNNLTASRLSALNYGSVTSPIPGQEVAQVARKVEEWAGRFPEIKFARADDPGVGLELVGVDVESVLSSASFANTEGNRKNLLKKLLYEELGVTETGRFDGDRYELVWRGSRRSIEVIFGNIRDRQDLRNDVFTPADPTSWRIVLDYPFDSGTFTPADDRLRIQELRTNGVKAQTVCWLPAALTNERKRDLQQLVIIDYVLTGQRFDEHARDLNPTDRHRARQTLTAQRDVLRDKLKETLRQAYGLTTKQPADIISGFDDHLDTLHGTLRPRLASGASLADAMRGLADQMLAVQYPGHPDFDRDVTGAIVKPSEVRLVLDYIRKAVEQPADPVEVEKPHRATMRRIANPLLLGEMHEAKFVLGAYWRQHFNQLAATNRVTGDLKLSQLAAWIEEPEPRGLEPLLVSLVIATYAEQTDQAFVYRGSVEPTTPELREIKLEMSLREQELPTDDQWATARQRAMEIFGHNPPATKRNRLATLFARQLSDDSRRYRDAARRLVEELERHADTLGLDMDATQGRLHTARCAADLLDGLGSQYGKLDIIGSLAAAELGGPGQRLGKSIKSAADVVVALRSGPWDNLEIIAGLMDPHRREAELILADLRTGAADDELTTSLAAALAKAGNEATTLIRKATAPPVPPEQPSDRPDVRYEPTAVFTARLAARELVEHAKKLAEDHPGATLEVTWRVIERS